MIGRAGSAADADNDRRPAERQARPRGASRRLSAHCLLGLVLLAAASPVAVVAEDDAAETRPLEIQRQQIDGRLGTIERKQEDASRPPVAGSRLDPYEPATPPSETRGARQRLDLERRTLEGRRDGVDRDLQRRDRGASPSSRGLVERLRRD